MCCAHSGNKGRESGGRAAGIAAVEDVTAGQPGARQSRTYRQGQPGRGAGHATEKGNKF